VFDASTYIEGKCIEGYDKAQLSLIKFSNYQKKRNSTNVASCSLFFVPDTRGKTAAELHRLYDSGNDNHASQGGIAERLLGAAQIEGDVQSGHHLVEDVNLYVEK
jgi:hypothetical protein